MGDRVRGTRSRDLLDDDVGVTRSSNRRPVRPGGLGPPPEPGDAGGPVVTKGASSLLKRSTFALSVLTPTQHDLARGRVTPS